MPAKCGAWRIPKPHCEGRSVAVARGSGQSSQPGPELTTRVAAIFHRSQTAVVNTVIVNTLQKKRSA
ncbi:MAG: hypothetical protein CMJ59_26250 [Planctomycetaceae bacterium]|nr:hypothetical protein [Planctomycetaceae bacterium]